MSDVPQSTYRYSYRQLLLIHRISEKEQASFIFTVTLTIFIFSFTEKKFRNERQK